MMISADLCLSCGSCSRACPIEAGGASPAGEPWDRSSCTTCGSCVAACPTDARELAGRSYAVSELLDEVDRDRTFFDVSGGGVTFSGGEPLSQPAFLEAALRECRARGIHTAVDTCGFAPQETMVEIAEIADLLLFDLKHMDPTVHERHTGVDNRLILDNLRVLSGSTAETWIRYPLIPGFNDDAAALDATATFVASLPRRHRFFVLPYHAMAMGKSHRLEKAANPGVAPDGGRLEAVRRVFESFDLEVVTGGSP
jgi:pyruvate formate lyase activating enzyme